MKKTVIVILLSLVFGSVYADTHVPTIEELLDADDKFKKSEEELEKEKEELEKEKKELGKEKEELKTIKKAVQLSRELSKNGSK